jgi:hypothetical protein
VFYFIYDNTTLYFLSNTIDLIDRLCHFFFLYKFSITPMVSLINIHEVDEYACATCQECVQVEWSHCDIEGCVIAWLLGGRSDSVPCEYRARLRAEPVQVWKHKTAGGFLQMMAFFSHHALV